MSFEIDDEALEAARRELNGEVPTPKEFAYACRYSEIPADGMRGKAVTIDRDEVALFRFEGELFAISNICPHEMSPLLAVGIVNCAARTVACPLHGWTFDITNGRRTDGPGTIETFEVKVDEGEVWVRPME